MYYVVIDEKGDDYLSTSSLGKVGLTYNQAKVIIGKFISPNPINLIMHYTTDIKLQSAISTAQNGQFSAHLIIDRDGTIIQMAPFNKKVQHVAGHNSEAIGIELVNAGMLLENKAGEWVCCTNYNGKCWTNEKCEYEKCKMSPTNVIPIEDRIYKVHKNPKFHQGKATWWQIYPEAQMNAAVEAAKAICNKYGIKNILGHDDYKVKRDPGPAFDMEAFKRKVFSHPTPKKSISKSKIQANNDRKWQTEQIFEPLYDFYKDAANYFFKNIYGIKDLHGVKIQHLKINNSKGKK